MSQAEARPIDLSSCGSCPARGNDLFAKARLREHPWFFDSFRHVELEPKQRLYSCEDSADYVYVLRTGMVKFTRYSTSGDQRIVRLARAGQSLGMEALLHRPYRHCVTAVVQTSLCRVPTATIRRYLTVDPNFIDNLLAERQEELDDADTFLIELSTGNAHARVARMLLYLSEPDAQARCHLPGRDEMGALLGVTTETASRVVAELKRDGLIRALEGGHWVWCDRAALLQIAGS